MSAHIEVNYDGDETAAFWIEKPVLRLGSGANCDVPIRSAGVAEHAATIQYRDGGYVVHNRGEAPLTVAQRTIAPGASEAWQDREALRVAPDVAVFLVIEGSAAPSRRVEDNTVLAAYQQKRRTEQAARELEGDEQATTEADSESSAGDAADARPSQSLQLFVGVSCFVAALALLSGVLYMTLGPSPKAASNDPLTDPSRIPDILLGNDEVREQLPRSITLALQEAQQSVRLQDADLARRRFERLRGELTRVQSSGEPLEVRHGDKTIDYGKALTRYINHYLAALEKKRR